MRKNFPLTVEGRHRDRVLDAVRHDIRKYLARERRRPVPEGAQIWAFDCRIGATQDTAEAVPVDALKARLDALAQQGLPGVYIEILARPALRPPRAKAPSEAPGTTD